MRAWAPLEPLREADAGFPRLRPEAAAAPSAVSLLVCWLVAHRCVRNLARVLPPAATCRLLLSRHDLAVRASELPRLTLVFSLRSRAEAYGFMAEGSELLQSSWLPGERLREQCAALLCIARQPAGKARRAIRAGVPAAQWRCPHALLAVPEAEVSLSFGVTAGEHLVALSCPRCLLAIIRRQSRCALRPAIDMGNGGGDSDASGRARFVSLRCSMLNLTTPAGDWW